MAESLTSSHSGSEGSCSTNLFERLKAHDPAAWRRLVHLHGPTVYRWCRQAGLQSQDAADVMQEVFRSVAVGLDGFRHDRPDDSFRGWLWTITRNKVFDHFRKRNQRPETVGTAEQQNWLAQLEQPQPPGPQDPTADTSLVHLVLEAIRGDFEDSSWEAFWRMTVQGQSSAEVAAELGISKSAVRQAKYRILRRLRDELEEVR